MYGYIYETTNLINGKKYIGQHKSEFFDTRYIGSGIILLEAVKKYGKENFEVKLIRECANYDELNAAEVELIKETNAVEFENYYNIAHSGEGHTCDPWNKGLKNAQKVTQKQLDTLEYGRHLPASDKQKQVTSERRRGAKASEETLEKLRKISKGKICINNGVKCIQIDPEQLDEYKLQGWKKGHLPHKQHNK